MNDVQVFNNPDFGDIRTVTIDGEPWFVGNDVAKVLGYANSQKAVRDRVDEDDKGVNEMDTPGGKQSVTVINESGLYSLILSSKLPSAKKFKRWVTSEVLPSIRKTGGYQPLPLNEQIQLIAKGYTDLDKRIDTIEDKFLDLPLFPSELQRVNHAAKRKGVEVMGGKHSPAYHDRSLCITIYRDIYGEIHRQFGVASYRDLRRTDVDNAINIINGYKLPIILESQIKQANA